MENQTTKKMIVINEYGNKLLAQHVMDTYDNIQLRKPYTDDYDPKTITFDVCKRILKSKNGMLKQIYVNHEGYGRYYLKTGLNGYQNMMREIRCMLCGRDYIDLDIKNCQPSLLSQYCKKKGVECDQLDYYVSERGSIMKELYELKEVINSYKQLKKVSNVVEKEFNDFVKLQFISAMYGGVFLIPKTKFMMKFEKEMHKIQAYIYANDAKAKQRTDEKDKKKNLEGSASSYLCQNMENVVLSFAKDWLIKQGYSIGSLIFDGCLVRNTVPMGKETIKELNKYILKVTGYKVEFEIKAWDNNYIVSDEIFNSLKLEEYQTVENDKEACDLVIESLNGDLIKSCNSYYCRRFENTNIYERIDKTEAKMRLLKIVSTMDIRKETEKGIKDYSKTTKGAKDIVEMVMSHLVDNLEFMEKINDASRRKLCFLNGYYDFITKEFCKYNDSVWTIPFINKNFEETYCKKSMKILEEEMLDRILFEIPKQDFMLKWLSRGIAGEVNDKTWMLGLGNRDSGKSVITKLSENAFDDYVSTFSCEELICQRGGNGDIAKKLMWIVPMQYSRVIFSNELKTDDENKKTKVDGNMIKSIASGGDTKKARELFEKEKKLVPQFRMCMFMNDIPEISPADAKETLSCVQFKTVFRDKVTEKEMKINEIKGACKFFNKDSKIDGYLQDPKIQMAWIHKLINSYDDKKVSMKDENEEVNDNSNDPEKKLADIFEYTLDPNDKLSNATIGNAIVGLDISKAKLAMIFKKNGAVGYHANERGYQGMKLIVKQEDA